MTSEATDGASARRANTNRHTGRPRANIPSDVARRDAQNLHQSQDRGELTENHFDERFGGRRWCVGRGPRRSATSSPRSWGGRPTVRTADGGHCDFWPSPQSLGNHNLNQSGRIIPDQNAGISAGKSLLFSLVIRVPRRRQHRSRSHPSRGAGRAVSARGPGSRLTARPLPRSRTRSRRARPPIRSGPSSTRSEDPPMAIDVDELQSPPARSRDRRRDRRLRGTRRASTSRATSPRTSSGSCA